MTDRSWGPLLWDTHTWYIIMNQEKVMDMHWIIHGKHDQKASQSIHCLSPPCCPPGTPQTWPQLRWGRSFLECCCASRIHVSNQRTLVVWPGTKRPCICDLQYMKLLQIMLIRKNTTCLKKLTNVFCRRSLDVTPSKSSFGVWPGSTSRNLFVCSKKSSKRGKLEFLNNVPSKQKLYTRLVSRFFGCPFGQPATAIPLRVTLAHWEHAVLSRRKMTKAAKKQIGKRA